MKKTRVLIVDDSALVRRAIADIIEAEKDLEVMATAGDPFVAVERMKKAGLPDVVLLDVEMPRMDGLSFLRKIMQQHPLPVVMCSSFTGEGTEATLKALEYGAVDVIEKPRLGTREFLEESRVRICDAIRAAGQARVRHRLSQPAPVPPKLTADAVLPKRAPRAGNVTTERVVVVGASTGGTEALKILLEKLPATAPGMVIVQHMPEGFTAAFAARLNQLCQVSVMEARDGDAVLPGKALIAPGNRHVMLERRGAQYFVKVADGPLVCRHRPSVDVLFRSAARCAGKNGIGVLMTGMGDDGASGLLEMREAGARTIAQDEATCVVFGMPCEAIRRGGVDTVLPLGKISAEILSLSAS